MPPKRGIGAAALWGGIAFLAGCQMVAPPEPVAPTPVALPLPAAPSQQSDSIKAYYANLQADLLVQGLMRVDGGGPDTPYTATMLARNFERIAFYEEHKLGTRLQSSSGEARLLARWDAPVRMKVEFGPSVPAPQRAKDMASINRFADRLTRVTGHPVNTTRGRGNFHVLVIGEDDRSAMQTRFAELLPNLTPVSRQLLQNLPRDLHCLVVVSHADSATPQIMSAVAIVRAEHPDLLRQACFHEELAQGMGLVNDSPNARPSIFNDDDEFALLTSHDEALLRMLYSPELKIGMSVDQARPIVRSLAAREVGQPL
ncbi:DUF2927 domain-containing protein [Cognatishimia sp. SS12]|uniref:DUF2927 domain-containing protein n=1 Tax=Cognatishimia sp. SS12 TaxID=2979465 RepID=UPI00232C3947|nr:DUF2927 domain-containing protein [Cognatishimia sp. SS12]MDC0738638.1 DUF2927 domain-containing protein [Cognatishimia sp. SS12]